MSLTVEKKLKDKNMKNNNNIFLELMNSSIKKLNIINTAPKKYIVGTI